MKLFSDTVLWDCFTPSQHFGVADSPNFVFEFYPETSPRSEWRRTSTSKTTIQSRCRCSKSWDSRKSFRPLGCSRPLLKILNLKPKKVESLFSNLMTITNQAMELFTTRDRVSNVSQLLSKHYSKIWVFSKVRNKSSKLEALHYLHYLRKRIHFKLLFNLWC